MRSLDFDYSRSCNYCVMDVYVVTHEEGEVGCGTDKIAQSVIEAFPGAVMEMRPVMSVFHGDAREPNMGPIRFYPLANDGRPVEGPRNEEDAKRILMRAKVLAKLTPEERRLLGGGL